MNKQEAYKELGLNPSASEDDIKSAFRKAAAKNHPDKFSDPNEKQKAEEKFKKLNTAQQVLLSKEPENNFTFNNGSGFNPFGGPFNRANIEDLFNDFFNHQTNANNKRIHKDDIYININLSFEESILGCEKEIKYNRDSRCNKCNGNGKIPGPATCKTCQGRGRIIIQQGHFRLEQGCPVCRGNGGKLDVCNECTGEGFLVQETVAKLKIPPVLKKDQNIRVLGGGHFIINDQFGESNNSDLYLRPIIENKENIYVDEQGNVISNIDITLLEAIEGCKKTIYTVKGDKEITIKPLSKNKDTIYINNCGAAGIRAHIVHLNVDYPSNINMLINYLKEIN
jgi:molecular chaperone DnaJ